MRLKLISFNIVSTEGLSFIISSRYTLLSLYQAAIDLILSELQVTCSDFLVDLGCGTGNINITAASRHSVSGLGVDIDSDLVKEAQKNATQAGIFSEKKILN